MIIIHGELYSSKNSRRIFRHGNGISIVKSAKSKAQEKDLGLQLNASRAKWEKMTDGTAKPLRVSFRIFRATHRRFDYVNIVQGLLDAMVASGYVPDDNADEVLPVFLPYQVDKANPRIEISLDGRGE